MNLNLHNVAKTATILLLGSVASIAVAQNSGSRVLVEMRTYGDPQNAAYNSICTGVRYYYYDADMRLQEIVNSKPLESGVFETLEYQTYNYDEANLLSSIKGFSYGQINYGDIGRQSSNASSVTNVYNEAGQLIEKTEKGIVIKYEYDTAGNMVKETTSTGKTVTYSDFIAPGKYKFASSTHTNKNNESEFYDESVTYDANGNKVSVMREYNEELGKTYFGKFYGHHVGDFLNAEEWMYDEEGNMTEHKKAVAIDEVSGAPKWNSRTEYSFVNGDKNLVMHRDYNLNSKGDWTTSAQYFVDEYRDFSSVMGAMDAALISVEQSTEGINNVLITFRPSSDANATMKLYCNGKIINTFSADPKKIASDADLTVNGDGTVTYTDREVQNDDYEYFLVTSVNDTEYCISNKLECNVYTELPAATGLCLSARRIISSSTVKISIGFNAPENAADYGFRDNLVIVNNSKSAHGTDTNANASEIALEETYDADKNLKIMIVSRYKYGNSESETIEINTSTTPVTSPTSISEIQTAVTTQGALLFDLTGRQVKTPSAGTFIMLKDGKAVKVNVVK